MFPCPLSNSIFSINVQGPPTSTKIVLIAIWLGYMHTIKHIAYHISLVTTSHFLTTDRAIPLPPLFLSLSLSLWRGIGCLWWGRYLSISFFPENFSEGSSLNQFALIICLFQFALVFFNICISPILRASFSACWHARAACSIPIFRNTNEGSYCSNYIFVIQMRGLIAQN